MTVDATQAPLEAVELSLRRLRLVGAVVLLGTSIARRGDSSSSVTFAIAVGLALFLLGANWASKQMMDDAAKQGRYVWLQLILDVVATTGAIMVFAPDPSAMAWVIIGLPVLEGAMRYRMVGAIGTSLAIGAALCTRVIVAWTPGSGLEPFIELAQPLALGLALGVPAGYLAEQLTAELVHAGSQNAEMQRRSRLLAVLTIAGQDLAGGEQRDVLETAVEAAKELGYGAVDIGEFNVEDHEWTRSFAQSDADRPTLAASAAEVEAVTIGKGRVAIGDDRVVSLIATEGGRALLLRGLLPTYLPLWDQREEAFGMLAANVSSAMMIAVHNEEVAAAQRRLHHSATHDDLTGLLNRAGLLAVLTTQLDRPSDRESSCSVLFVDLDSFKEVNDTYGHGVGDSVLCEVADRLRGHVPPAASIARMGGDEFVVVVPEITPSDVPGLRDRVDRVLAEPVQVGSRQLQVGSSTGIYVVEDVSVSPEDALRQADADMYDRKRSSQRAKMQQDRVLPPLAARGLR